jgi:hypothetical protein
MESVPKMNTWSNKAELICARLRRLAELADHPMAQDWYLRTVAMLFDASAAAIEATQNHVSHHAKVWLEKNPPTPRGDA